MLNFRKNLLKFYLASNDFIKALWKFSALLTKLKMVKV